MKLSIYVFIVCILSLFAQAKPIDVTFFYGEGCPHCAQMEDFFVKIQHTYPDLNIISYEVYYDQSNQELFKKMASDNLAVPTVFINGKKFVGYSDSIAESLEQEIKRCSDDGCGKVSETKTNPEIQKSSNLFLIFVSLALIIVILILYFLIK